MVEESVAQIEEHERLVSYIQKNCPEEIGTGNLQEGESAVDIAIRWKEERDKAFKLLRQSQTDIDAIKKHFRLQEESAREFRDYTLNPTHNEIELLLGFTVTFSKEKSNG